MLKRPLTRRSILKAAALTPPAMAAGALPLPFVHGAYAAGTLTMGAWDHWVPGAGKELERICQEWAAKEKVELVFDLITSNGDKDLLTLMAEGQAGAGHDIMGLRTWYVEAQKHRFVPVDDVVEPLIQKYGKVKTASEYCSKIDGHWMAVPSSYGSSALPPCARIDMLKQYAGIDVQKMYPAPGMGAPDKELRDNWTWETFLKAAEACAKNGHPFGLGLSTCTDALNMAGAVFAAFGSFLVDEKGEVTVKTDGTRQALDFFKRLSKHLPEEVYAYDNASNNKALVSGYSALIMNPPSAYAVAKRDAAKIAEQLWTINSPKGPAGRYDPANYYFWGIWNFSKNVPAAKALLTHISQREVQEKLVTASVGFDIPPFPALIDFKVWEEEGPPKGTVYNYPSRDDAVPFLSGYPAPLKIGTQMYAQALLMKMIAMHAHQGASVEQAMSYAESEIEGYLRT
jgi:ABC-type glycerol-3-phosphate transport system substrate-binding protein